MARLCVGDRYDGDLVCVLEHIARESFSLVLACRGLLASPRSGAPRVPSVATQSATD
jgi:hypothetical protein